MRAWLRLLARGGLSTTLYRDAFAGAGGWSVARLVGRNQIRSFQRVRRNLGRRLRPVPATPRARGVGHGAPVPAALRRSDAVRHDAPRANRPVTAAGGRPQPARPAAALPGLMRRPVARAAESCSARRQAMRHSAAGRGALPTNGPGSRYVVPGPLTTAFESLFMFVLQADSPANGLRGDADPRHAQFTPGAEPSRRVKIF